MTIVMIIWMVTPLVSIYLAMRKKRDRNFWVFTTFLCPPLILILLFLPKRSKAPTKMFGHEREQEDGFFPNRD